MKLRLFFALWPDEAVRRALGEAARPLLEACRGRLVARRNYHLTVAFLGGVPVQRFDAVLAAAAGVKGERFTLSMDCHGHFPRPRVAWLGCRHPPPAAEALARALWKVLEPLGFQADPRPFTPHLTVLRSCPRCDWEGPLAPVEWPVRDFVLVRSETLPAGPRYEIVEKFGLHATRGG